MKLVSNNNESPSVNLTRIVRFFAAVLYPYLPNTNLACHIEKSKESGLDSHYRCTTCHRKGPMAPDGHSSDTYALGRVENTEDIKEYPEDSGEYPSALGMCHTPYNNASNASRPRELG